MPGQRTPHRPQEQADVTRPAAVTRAMTSAINGMRAADGELAKLLALRTAAQKIAPFGDIAALDHLSAVAIDIYDLDVDAVQHAIAEGVSLSEKPATNGAKPPAPFTYVDIARATIPPREWAVADVIPARAVTLFSGNGAIGKSLLALQLCAATVLGGDWVTMLPGKGPAIFFTAEDDDDELCRRLERIAAHYASPAPICAMPAYG